MKYVLVFFAGVACATVTAAHADSPITIKFQADPLVHVAERIATALEKANTLAERGCK